MPFLAILKSPLFLKAMGLLAVLAMILLAWERVPVVGPHARIERIEASRNQWKTAAGSWEASAGSWTASFRQAERLRGQEAGRAVAAVNSEQKSCDARLAEARRSSLAIERMLNAPPKLDAHGCPARELLDPRSVRDAITAPGR